MRLFLNLIIFVGVCMCSGAITAATPHHGDASVLDAIDEYLATLPAEEGWSKWITEHAPTYGNYCGPGYGDPTYQQPCLSRLDCICKAHDFGYHLRKYNDADAKMLSDLLETPIVDEKKNPDFETFLNLMGVTLFAGKLLGENLDDKVKSDYAEYKRKPKEARKKLEELIDQNDVFKRKIEDIQRERMAFEGPLSPSLDPHERTMSLSILPFHLFAGVFAVNYELKFRPFVTWHFGVSVYGGGLQSAIYQDLYIRKIGVSAEFGPKLYMVGEAFYRGFYLLPRILIDFEEGPQNLLSNNYLSRRTLGIMPALLVGFDRIFSFGLSLDVGVGVAYHYALLLSGSFPHGASPSGLLPVVQAAVGYAW